MEKEIASLIVETLGLDEGTELDDSSQLLGHIPEFDSMAVVALLTEIESAYGVEFDDDDITAEAFDTVGSLVTLVESKL